MLNSQSKFTFLNHRKGRFGKRFVVKSSRTFGETLDIAQFTLTHEKKFQRIDGKSSIGTLSAILSKFHGVFDTSMIKNTFIAAGGQGQVFKCECSQELDISNGSFMARKIRRNC